MDNRITKKRLKDLLAYDWVKLIIFCVLIVFGVELIWTVSADRISAGEEFIVYACDVTVTDSVYDSLSKLKETEQLSFDIRKYSYNNLGTYNTTDAVVSQQLAAYTGVGQGDIFLLADLNREKKDENDNIVLDDKGQPVNESTFCKIANSLYLYDITQLIADARKYCEDVGDFKADGSYDEDKIRSNFNTRLKGDNRRQKGMIDSSMEIKRLVVLWENVLKIEPLLAKDELWVTYDIAFLEQGEKKLGLNLSKLTGGEKNITDYCNAGVQDEDGNITSEGAVLSVFNAKQHQPHLMFEVIPYINYVISTYSNLYA